MNSSNAYKFYYQKLTGLMAKYLNMITLCNFLNKDTFTSDTVVYIQKQLFFLNMVKETIPNFHTYSYRFFCPQKSTHSSILAWRIPQTVESMGSQRVGHDRAIFTSLQSMNETRKFKGKNTMGPS